MNESDERLAETARTRLRLPWGYGWTMPRGPPPEGAMADLRRHQSDCGSRAEWPAMDPRFRAFGRFAPTLGEVRP